MPERLIAIGDIHGCSDALQTLIKAIDPTPDDTLVVLGDVVDRGSATRQAVDMLLEIAQQSQLIALQGNHEEMMLRVLDGESPQRWLQFGGIDTLDSYGFTGDFSAIPESHHAFYHGMLDYYETDGYFFTHAAYKHDLPLEYQPVELLRWHSLREGLPPAHENGKICFVGHTAHKEGEIMDFGHIVCLDTYCYGGRWLTAMDVRTRQTWQSDPAGQLRTD
ncbi:Serine/threonine-protein phosphatase 1 [Rosistilla oblonga]|uniref:Serine/threonine-protein phosphatase 1 n=1 Tax=Rosistilla oblonga TaxID=2527990 RepID=A0A518ISH1_9BACT|nr:Serine/threonine-protein phosphatase 1 [Rosistilla oblonga]QDV56020.1 Serine/threonine-protein phosphatase 1 [Rosistilla oblonga]